MPAPDCRLGIDVGGTNTDAVIMDGADRVIAKAKVPGTPDITGGIVAAIDAVHDGRWGMMTALHSTEVELVPLGDAVAEVRHVPVEQYQHFDVLFG